MNKIEELAALKEKVALLETEVLPEATAQIEAKRVQINTLFDEITSIAKAAKLKPTIQIGGNDITLDVYGDWVPGYDSDWYSSSASC